MMNLNWIREPLAIYGTVGASGAACLYLLNTIRVEFRRNSLDQQQKIHQLGGAVQRLETDLTALSREVEQEALARAECIAPPLARGINVQKRAEALRLFRKGADCPAVAAKLGLSRAETALLDKIRRILADESHARPAAQEHPSSVECSLEA